jgi:hypothetical protein
VTQIAGIGKAAASPLPRPQGLAGALAAPVLGMGMAIYDHIVAKLTDGGP